MNTPRNDDHTRIVELMPWYVNGTLAEEERRHVERHVSECLPCRRALNEERRLRGLVAGGGTSPDSLEHGLDRLLGRIDADAHARPVRYRHRLALAAGLAALAVGIWAMWPRPPSSEGEFTTLTSAGGPRASRVDVVFEPDASPAEIDAALREIGASVLAGPSGIGRYTIALPGETTEEIERGLDALRADPSVRLVAPAFDEDAAP